MINKLLEVTNRIFLIREQKVMLDADLAELYGVTVSALNQAVKRNKERFPDDFCFLPTNKDLEVYKSQIVIYKRLSTGKRARPTVFTEQGAYALSFVLRSPQAIEMGVFIARAFKHLRRFILENENLMMELKNLDQLSKRFEHFEHRIHHNLLVLYKNATKNEERFKFLESEIEKLKKRIVQS